MNTRTKNAFGCIFPILIFILASWAFFHFTWVIKTYVPDSILAANNLKQIAVAIHTYHDVEKHLPPAFHRDEKGKPLLSWRVLILPYLEHRRLYDQFKLDEPWNSPNNIKLLDQMPEVYDATAGNGQPGMTHFQVFVGPKAAFELEPPILNDFVDGPGQIILVIEARNPVPWTKPQDLLYDPKKSLPAVGMEYLKPGIVFGQRLYKRKTVQFATADTGIVRLELPVDQELLIALITRNCGEIINADLSKGVKH